MMPSKLMLITVLLATFAGCTKTDKEVVENDNRAIDSFKYDSKQVTDTKNSPSSAAAPSPAKKNAFSYDVNAGIAAHNNRAETAANGKSKGGK